MCDEPQFSRRAIFFINSSSTQLPASHPGRPCGVWQIKKDSNLFQCYAAFPRPHEILKRASNYEASSTSQGLSFKFPEFSPLKKYEEEEAGDQNI